MEADFDASALCTIQRRLHRAIRAWEEALASLYIRVCHIAPPRKNNDVDACVGDILHLLRGNCGIKAAVEAARGVKGCGYVFRGLM